jgi:hypothetical protein
MIQLITKKLGYCQVDIIRKRECDYCGFKFKHIYSYIDYWGHFHDFCCGYCLIKKVFNYYKRNYDSLQ